MDLSSAIADRAANLLKDVNLIYGLVSGVMLKFVFDWSSQTERYNKGRSLMAVGLAIASLTFVLVLVALMGGVAVDSWTAGSFEPSVIVFNMVFLVVFVLLAVACVALVRSLVHLRRVLRALRSPTTRRTAESPNAQDPGFP
jgi:hypothetical protein